MVRLLTDEKVAEVMELHHGVGLCWKTIARRYGVDVGRLRNAIENAKNYGMKKYMGKDITDHYLWDGKVIFTDGVEIGYSVYAHTEAMAREKLIEKGVKYNGMDCAIIGEVTRRL